MDSDRSPAHLSRKSKQIWKRINAQFQLDFDFLVILKTAMEAYDRMNQTRKIINEEGITIATPTGFVKPHPCLRIEKEARAGFLIAWRALNLGIEPPK